MLVTCLPEFWEMTKHNIKEGAGKWQVARLMVKICVKIMSNPVWGIFFAGGHVTSVFQGLYLSCSRGQEGEDPGNEVVSIIGPDKKLPPTPGSNQIAGFVKLFPLVHIQKDHWWFCGVEVMIDREVKALYYSMGVGMVQKAILLGMCYPMLIN